MELRGESPQEKTSAAYYAAALAIGSLYRLGDIDPTMPFKLSSSGLENLPAEGPYMLAFTHHNAWDVPSIGALIYRRTKRPIHFLTAEELLEEGTFSSRILRPMHTLPISREQTGHSQVANAIKTLKDGHVIGIAPEGRRVDGDKVLEKLKGGVGFIAARANVVVLPVGVAGRNLRLRQKNLPFIPRSVHVHISEPLELGGTSREHATALDQRLQPALQESLEQAYSHYGRVHGKSAARRLDRST